MSEAVPLPPLSPPGTATRLTALATVADPLPTLQRLAPGAIMEATVTGGAGGGGQVTVDGIGVFTLRTPFALATGQTLTLQMAGAPTGQAGPQRHLKILAINGMPTGALAGLPAGAGPQPGRQRVGGPPSLPSPPLPSGSSGPMMPGSVPMPAAGARKMAGIGMGTIPSSSAPGVFEAVVLGGEGKGLAPGTRLTVRTRQWDSSFPRSFPRSFSTGHHRWRRRQIRKRRLERRQNWNWPPE